VSGATISLLKLNDLPKLEIPVSDREAQQQIIADFDQEVALQSQIDEIHKKQTELAKKYWSLD
jgi:restriction endonuclease S subunit